MPPNKSMMEKYVFSDAYREEIFHFWYSNRHLGPRWFDVRVPPDENDHKVTLHTVNQWANLYHWEERAEDIDLQIANRMDREVIDERIEMFREHAKIGREIKDFGLDYLRENGIKTDMAALRAIADGIQIERSSRGLADSLVKLAQMDDTTLVKTINKLLTSRQDAIEADVEDITPPDEDNE